MPNDSVMLDVQDVICDIGNVLETMNGVDLAKLHNEICDSKIVYMGDSMFARSQEDIDRVKVDTETD